MNLMAKTSSIMLKEFFVFLILPVFLFKADYVYTMTAHDRLRAQRFEQSRTIVEKEIVPMLTDASVTPGQLREAIEALAVKLRKMPKKIISEPVLIGGRSLMHYYAVHGTCVEKLIMLLGFTPDLSVRDNTNKTPLDLAIARKKIIFINGIASRESNLNDLGKYLVKALFTGDPETLYDILRAHSVKIYGEIGTLEPRDTDGVSREHLVSGMRLINQVNYASNLLGDPYIRYAVEEPPCADNGDTCLHTLARFGRCDLIPTLIQRHSSELFKLNNEGLQPIHVAVLEYCKRFKLYGVDDNCLRLTVKCLVECGNALREAVPHVLSLRATTGFTPLHLACLQANKVMISLLLGLGSDPDAPLMLFDPATRTICRTDASKTPRFLAEKKGLAAFFNDEIATRDLLDKAAMLQRTYQKMEFDGARKALAAEEIAGRDVVVAEQTKERDLLERHIVDARLLVPMQEAERMQRQVIEQEQTAQDPRVLHADGAWLLVRYAEAVREHADRERLVHQEASCRENGLETKYTELCANRDAWFRLQQAADERRSQELFVYAHLKHIRVEMSQLEAEEDAVRYELEDDDLLWRNVLTTLSEESQRRARACREEQEEAKGVYVAERDQLERDLLQQLEQLRLDARRGYEELLSKPAKGEVAFGTLTFKDELDLELIRAIRDNTKTAYDLEEVIWARAVTSGCSVQDIVAKRIDVIEFFSMRPQQIPQDSWVTLLHYAIQYGSLEKIKKLIALGAHVNALDGGQSTPLHVAVYMNKSPQLIQELLRSGADYVEIKNKYGFGAYELAKFLQHDHVRKTIKTFYHQQTREGAHA